jgi:ankyrin repeat protein
MKAEEDKRRLKYCDPIYEKNLRISSFIQKIRNCIVKIKKINSFLPNDWTVSNKIFERKGSFLFFSAIKSNDYSYLEIQLKKNPLLVFDVNHNFETALHVACKRSSLDIVKLLLKNKADVNALDSAGRSPLFIGLQKQDVEICRHLLYFGAYPFSNRSCNFEREMNKNQYIKYYVKEARKIYVNLVFVGDKPTKIGVWESKRKVFTKRAEFSN